MSREECDNHGAVLPCEFCDDETTAYESLCDQIAELMTEPETDNPIDVLKNIARAIGVHHYTYFDDLGEWVGYPNAGTGSW